MTNQATPFSSSQQRWPSAHTCELNSRRERFHSPAPRFTAGHFGTPHARIIARARTPPSPCATDSTPEARTLDAEIRRRTLLAGRATTGSKKPPPPPSPERIPSNAEDRRRSGRWAVPGLAPVHRHHDAASPEWEGQGLARPSRQSESDYDPSNGSAFRDSFHFFCRGVLILKVYRKHRRNLSIVF